jgi:23S rRNA (uracil1939-C5)-methyltransferase
LSKFPKENERPTLQLLRIERLANHAFGVAHAEDGKVVFVSDAAPGDLAQVQLDEDKGNYYEAHIVKLQESSPARVQPACPYVVSCGGCSWQHINYPTQCMAKRNAVVDALEHLAHISEARAEALVGDCRPSKRQLHYRNKLELGASFDPKGGFELGFYREESHVITAPDTCLLAHQAIAKAPKALRGALGYAQGSSDLGIYRVGVRQSEATGSLEVALWTEPKTSASFPRARVAKIIQDALRPTSIVRVVAAHDKLRDVRKVEVLAGNGFWQEQLGDLRYYTSAPSFFQVNSAQAETLVHLVIDCLQQDNSSLANLRIADLYAGGGTFSLPLAAAGAEVVAVESAGSSVRDLRRNAEINALDVEIIGGDSERELPSLSPLDALVVDPPRAGLTKGAVAAIAQTAPVHLVYVSCNPATWARDVARLEQSGYQLEQAHPVDLFPQTAHVEVVSSLFLNH